MREGHALHNTSTLGPPSRLPALAPIAHVLDAWAEQTAELSERSVDAAAPPGSALRAAVPWAVAELADAAEDRLRPPRVAAADDASDFTAGDLEPHPLGLRREVISTVARFRAAITRTDEAYAILERQTEAALREAEGCWTAASQDRAEKLAVRLHATRRRREAMRACCTDNLRVLRFRCGCCGGLQLGVPDQCNSRTCPRCVRKIRAQNMARLHELLGAIDDDRRKQSRPLPRWRFLTLTAPSWTEFAPMRRTLGAAFAVLIRRHVWQDVHAAVAAWETTHGPAGWHVHAHVIADAYLPVRQVGVAWQGAVLRVLASALRHGQFLAGLPAVAAAAADAIRADASLREHVGRVVTRAIRLAETSGTDVRALLAAPGPWAIVEGPRRRGGRDVLADFSALLPSLAAALPVLGAQHVKEPQGRDANATRSAVVSEMAKYLAKDLGAGPGEDESDWGVRGTAARLASFMDGARRWRTFRCYGDALAMHMRDRRQSSLECDECGSNDVAPEGFEWLSPVAAGRLMAAQAEKRRERLRWRGGGGGAEGFGTRS